MKIESTGGENNVNLIEVSGGTWELFLTPRTYQLHYWETGVSGWETRAEKMKNFDEDHFYLSNGSMRVRRRRHSDDFLWHVPASASLSLSSSVSSFLFLPFALAPSDLPRPCAFI